MITTIVPRLTMPEATDLEAVLEATAIERQWYGDTPRYHTNEDVIRAINAGRLIEVILTQDILPIHRLRNPATDNWCYAGRLVVRRLFQMADLWRAEIDEQGLDPEGRLRLSVTSLVRTVEQQKRIVQSGALAVPNSTHEVGEAGDFDASGYYRWDCREGLQSIPHPDRSPYRVDTISRTLHESAGLGNHTPPIRRPELYDARITDTLVGVAHQMMMDGLVNTVVEFPNTSNRCVHFAANPTVV